MVSNYVTSDLLGSYLKRLVRSRIARHGPDYRIVDIATEAFDTAVLQGEFTETWFDRNIPIWAESLATFKACHLDPNILEVGSWEGRSTLFLLTYFPSAHVAVIDTWAGGDEHQRRRDLSLVERRFDSNVAQFRDRLTKMRGRSAEMLARLASYRPNQFDLIYLDGSHYADDLIVDASLAWTLLQRDGVMIFDDYLWEGYRINSKNPCRAINLFLRLIAGEYEIYHAGYQIMIRKKACFRDQLRARR